MATRKVLLGAFRRACPIAAALGALGALPSADGNVTAFADAAGDLWLVGDDLDNSVQVGASDGGEPEFRVRGGDATTTVNGQPEVIVTAPGTRIIVLLGDGADRAWLGTEYGANPSCCQRDFVVLAGKGDDAIDMIGPSRSVDVRLGPGNDGFGVSEGASGISGRIDTGAGDDRIEVSPFTGVGGRIAMGAGVDRLVIGRHSGGDVVVDTGPDGDYLTFDELGGAFEVATGGGDDVVEFPSFEGGSLVLDTGDGHDRAALDAASDADDVELLSVVLGAGDDHLRVAGATITEAFLDGGAGFDAYIEPRPNDYAGVPELRSFEVPRGTAAPEPEFPTTIVGRVVQADGAPVVGASVALPELGRLTSTGADGAFSLEVVGDRRRLELTAGATVLGNAASGAAAVELLPLGRSDAGDVVLGLRRENALVLGTAEKALELEANLVTLGFRPEQVTRLSSLPPDLAHYDVVWHAGRVLTSAERARLLAFVRAGGGLHLTAQGAAAGVLERFVNDLLTAQTIEVRTNATGPHAFAPDAVGGVTTTPHVLTSFGVGDARFLLGVGDPNVLVARQSGEAFGAAWDSAGLVGGRGRLTLLTTDSWIDAGQNLDVLLNLQTFLQRQPRAAVR